MSVRRVNLLTVSHNSALPIPPIGAANFIFDIEQNRLYAIKGDGSTVDLVVGEQTSGNTSGGGSGSFTGGTISGPSNFTAPLTATTLYSGSTEISNLFARLIHTHNITEVDGLQIHLDNKANLSGATFGGNIFAPIISAITMYSGTTEVSNLFARTSHTHPISGITNLSTYLNNSMPTNTIVLLGDSYSAQHKSTTGNGTTTPSIGYMNWANMKLKRKLHVLNYGGIAGQSTTQIMGRLQGDALAYSPAWIAIQGGINDINASVASGTIYNNLVSMYDTAITAGTKVIGFTIPIITSWSGNTTRLNTAHDINNRLKQYARGKNNFLLIDWNIVLNDPNTGLINTAYTYDTTHLSVLGCALAGEYITSILNPLFPDIDMLPSSVNDFAVTNSASTFANLCPNGMMTGSTSNLSTGWNPNVTISTGGTGTVNVDYEVLKTSSFDPANGKFRNFNWQQLRAMSAYTSEKRFAYRPSTGAMAGLWQTGDYLYAECEFEADNDWTAVTRFNLALNTLVSSGSVINSIDMFTNGTTNGAYPNSTSLQYIPRSGVLRTYPVQMSSLVTAVYPEVQFYAQGGTVRVGRFAIRKATPIVVGSGTTFLY